ncbi:MAG: hypothetical protein LC768_04650 [Acidobacteria bacterium]|nr:hypothetical protein [Acidobacteriota bacterium]MCA1637615.1 hypothetical protein [Acidobacteriota bacterium]
MKEDGFAEISWLANDSLILSFDVYDSAKKNLLNANSSEDESVLFVAPKDGIYTLVVRYDKSSEITERQNISLEYSNKFKLPAGTKQKDVRKINGYDVKIMTTPETETESGDSIVLIEKNGRLKKILKSGAGGVAGFSFGDDITKAYSAKAKRVIPLIKNTVDKTGDGVPDVMIDYYSGGAHCCFETYFINLGETVETVESIGTGHVGMTVSGKNPKGGLLFETADNGYAYWLGGFAGSPFPDVILEFRKGKLQPNFELMKKPAPSLSVLKKKAQVARQQLSLEPYKGEDNEDSVLYKQDVFPETVFWGVMLDLIYTGHEDLAWQYLDLVWDTRKQGKQLFIRDFKQQLSDSQYWQMIEEDRNSRK